VLFWEMSHMLNCHAALKNAMCWAFEPNEGTAANFCVVAGVPIAKCYLVCKTKTERPDVPIRNSFGVEHFR
jgi:hypothetical protein